MPLPWYTWSRIARKQWWDVLNGTTWMPSRTRRINCRDSGSTKYENRPSFFESHASFARTVRLKSRADVIMRQDIVVWNLFTASATARRPFSPFFFFFPFLFLFKKGNRRASVPPILDDDDDTTRIETCVRSLTRDEIEERSQPPVGYCTVVRLWIDNIDDAREAAPQRILDSLARGTGCFGRWSRKDGFEKDI